MQMRILSKYYEGREKGKREHVKKAWTNGQEPGATQRASKIGDEYIMALPTSSN
jgi:hypothetical protein